ncbi:MAG: glycolate oxidase subunit GlcF [Limnohabitans sp.]
MTMASTWPSCPSGVQYGQLVDIGRKLVDAKVPRPVGEKVVRWALKEGLPSPLFAPAMKLGQLMREVLHETLKAKVPARQDTGEWPTRTHARKVLMLAGCVQPSMSPNINFATARVLDACGIQTVVAPEAGCCGAVKFHLNDQDGGRSQMRANIDAWWPLVEGGEVEAIVMNASGCGVTVKEYGHILQHDAAYADKAARISALTKDLSELMPALLPELKARIRSEAIQAAGLQAYHPPCTLQHGQQLKGGVEALLTQLGFEVKTAANEAHLCCGSAGTYSVLNPDLSKQLRDRKLGHLQALQPEGILSANIGCITHLQSGCSTSVRHWVELLDEAISVQ